MSPCTRQKSTLILIHSLIIQYSSSCSDDHAPERPLPESWASSFVASIKYLERMAEGHEYTRIMRKGSGQTCDCVHGGRLGVLAESWASSEALIVAKRRALGISLPLPSPYLSSTSSD